MKLEDQVVSLEIAIRLKQLKFKQKSLFYWYRGIMVASGYKRPEIVSREFYEDHNVEKACYSAYTVSELGEMLPRDVASFKKVGQNGHTLKGWTCRQYSYAPNGSITYDSIDTNADTEADARAKMLIYLKEKELV